MFDFRKIILLNLVMIILSEGNFLFCFTHCADRQGPRALDYMSACIPKLSQSAVHTGGQKGPISDTAHTGDHAPLL